MSVDVKRLRKERVYEARVPVAAVADDLATIQTLASDWHATHWQLIFAGIFTLLGGIASWILFYPIGIMLVLLALGILLRAPAYPKGASHSARRCAVAKSVTGMLVCDADAREPAAIRLAFKPKQELLSEAEMPHRKRGKQRLYKSSWFSLEAGLHDGSTFSETIDDVVRQRKFVNPRGKSRTKTRTRSVVAMRIAYPSNVYGDATPLAARMKTEIHLPPSALLRGVEVTDRAVKTKAVVNKPEDLAQTSAMLALGVYRMLNLARKLSARKGAK